MKKLKPMVRLTKAQIQDKLDFRDNYKQSSNAASGSAVDANANISVKTVGTLGNEIFKDFHIQVNRAAMHNEITRLFDTETADKYIDMLESHLIYKHDESSKESGMPYCVAINMYPFAEHGMKTFGGESSAPKHLNSFCGGFINLIFAVSSQFAGAVATVEFLMYFDYYARKTYGEDYLETHLSDIEDCFQQVVHTLNTPCAARGDQAVFWNISVFDKYFFDSLFSNFAFPDLTKPNWTTLEQLQYQFMDWFRRERTKCVLTFPVLTEASLNLDGKPRDPEYAEKMAQFRADGLSFFSYNDENAASLSSCCRLSNKISDFMENEFSYSLGAGGVSTGSTSVITININRLMQEGHNLEDTIDLVHKFQYAHRQLVEDDIKTGLLSSYTAGFISTAKQFTTLGVLGLNEAAEFKGIKVSNNPEYIAFVKEILGTFKRKNQKARMKYGIMFNTELVPGESLGVKFAQWDIKDGLQTKRECYNSYLYLPEDDSISIPDKFILHGGEIAEHMDGGSALHLNVAKLPDKEFFLWLRTLAAKTGCKYWTTNVLSSICKDCGHINADTMDTCIKCGSSNIEYATRVIGFLKKIGSFAEARQKEHSHRFYH